MRRNGRSGWLWLAALALLVAVAGLGLWLRWRPSPMVSALSSAGAERAHALTYHDGRIYAGTEIGLFSGPSDRFLRPAQGALGRPITAVVPTEQGVYLAGPELGVASLEGARLAPLLAGNVTALAAGPDGRLVAALAEGELLTSQDGGQSWQRLTSPDLEVQALAIHPDDSDWLVAGGAHGTAGRVAYSTDGAQTWEHVDDLDRVSSLAFDPTTPDRLYAAAGGMIWASLDNGVTWAPRFQVPGHEVKAVAFDNRRKPVLVILTPAGQIIEPLLY